MVEGIERFLQFFFLTVNITDIAVNLEIEFNACTCFDIQCTFKSIPQMINIGSGEHTVSGICRNVIFTVLSALTVERNRELFAVNNNFKCVFVSLFLYKLNSNNLRFYIGNI